MILWEGGMKMIYGYARVSTNNQNLDRQIEALKKAGVEQKNIFCDKESGTTFNRSYFNLLVGTDESASMLREGDLLVVCSIDRLGRNYSEITKQWQKITKEIKADIKVLDMPLLNTAGDTHGLDQQFLSDLVLQILSYVADKERINIKERQRQGIEAAKAKGKSLGRPKIQRPDNFEDIYKEWKNGEITAVDAMKELGIKRGTFYKFVKEYEKRI